MNRNHKSASSTRQALHHNDSLKTPKDTVREIMHLNAPMTSKDRWTEGDLEVRFPGWSGVFLDQVLTAAEGILEAEMVTIPDVLRRSVTRIGQVPLPRIDTITDIDTTTHTATDHRTTLPTIPEATTDRRITVVRTTNILDPTTGARTTTRVLMTRESDETIITEVIPVNTRPKVGIIRIATETVILPRDTEIRRAHRSWVRHTTVRGTERTKGPWTATAIKDDSVCFY